MSSESNADINVVSARYLICSRMLQHYVCEAEITDVSKESR